MKQMKIAFKTYSNIQSNGNNNSFFHRDNLFVMAEGVGGEYLSKVTKDLVCMTIADSFFNDLSENQSPGNALLFALKQANMAIIKERNSLGEKMAVSISVVYLRDNIMYFTYLGDSRIYFFYGNEIHQLTRDHALVEEDSFTDRPFDDPRLIANGLGIHEKLDIKVRKYPLPKKGFIMMTTAGLMRKVSNRELLRLSSKNKKPERLKDDLFNLILKKGGSVTANVTVGIIRFGGIPKGGMRKIIFTYSVFFLMIVILIGGYFIKHEGDGEKPNNKGQIIQEEIEKEVRDIPDVKTPQVKISPVKKIIKKQLEKKKTVMAYNVDRIFSFVGEWKKAWEMSAGINGDMNRFLSYYSDRFKADGFDKEAWRRDKTSKNRKKKWIRIEISDIRISGSNDKKQMEVRFFQDYRSSNYSSKGEKLIVLSEEMDGWKILFERGS